MNKFKLNINLKKKLGMLLKSTNVIYLATQMTQKGLLLMCQITLDGQQCNKYQEK